MTLEIGMRKVLRSPSIYNLPPADERTLTVGLEAIVYNLEEVVI